MIWYIAVKNNTCIWYDTMLIDYVMYLSNDFSKKVLLGCQICSALHRLNISTSGVNSLRQGEPPLKAIHFICYSTSELLTSWTGGVRVHPQARCVRTPSPERHFLIKPTVCYKLYSMTTTQGYFKLLLFLLLLRSLRISFVY